MICQSHEIGCVWKPGFLKSGYICGKIWTVKLLIEKNSRFKIDSPNLPMFSTANVLRYMVSY